MAAMSHVNNRAGQPKVWAANSAHDVALIGCIEQEGLVSAGRGA